MKKNLILLTLFALLGGGAYFFLKNKNPKSTLRDEKNTFAVEDTASIGKVFLADMKGRTTLIERKGHWWQINGTFRANENRIKNLMETLYGMQVAYPTPEPSIDGALKAIAARGIKVEVFDRKNEKLKVFYIGGGNINESATTMLMEGSSTPYLMNLSTSYGGLRTRFKVESEEWRDRNVFAEGIENIQSVSIDYPFQKSKSFKLDLTNNGYQVTPFYANMPRSTKPYRNGFAEAYLAQYEKLAAEAIDNNNPGRDSITAQPCFCIINLKNKQGEEHVLRVHPINQVRTDEQANPYITKVDRYFAHSSKGDLFLIQNAVFQKVFWAYSSFFE